MKTADELTKMFEANDEVAAIIKKTIKFKISADEDCKFIDNDFDYHNLMEDVSIIIAENTVSCDDFTDEYGIVCDFVAEVIIDEYITNMKEIYIYNLRD